jgi:hypothetical protein
MKKAIVITMFLISSFFCFGIENIPKELEKVVNLYFEYQNGGIFDNNWKKDNMNKLFFSTGWPYNQLNAPGYRTIDVPKIVKGREIIFDEYKIESTIIGEETFTFGDGNYKKTISPDKTYYVKFKYSVIATTWGEKWTGYKKNAFEVTSYIVIIHGSNSIPPDDDFHIVQILPINSDFISKECLIKESSRNGYYKKLIDDLKIK